jgi:membrane-associated phospholipid phosphatase
VTSHDLGYGVRMPDRRYSYLAWLVVLLAGHAVAFIAVWKFFVQTRHGQLLDAIALTGDTIGRRHVDKLVNAELNVISVLSLAAATAAIGFIALVRRRIILALVTMFLVAGANITTQVLKHGLGRPDLGVDSAVAEYGNRAMSEYGNSLPSGHATVAGSVAVALVLVLPPRLRGLGGLLGAGYAALTGVATLSAGWHRPSDAVAAMLIVGGWAAFAGILLVLTSRRDDVVESQDKHSIAASLLAFAGITLLAVAAGALKLTDDVVLTPLAELSTRRLFVAYAGSAAGVAGVAGVVMAFLMVTVPGVVARRRH